MKRAAFDDKDESGGPRSGDNYQPCRHCRGSTPLAMLGQYGGLCHSCYGAWTQEHQPGVIVPLTRDEKHGIVQRLRTLNFGDKSRTQIWASLMGKARRGEELTIAQQTMLKAGTRGLRTAADREQSEDEAA